MTEQRPPDAVDAAGSSESSTVVRVLLLDDDAANLLLRGAVLRQNGYETLCASSVQEATELLDNVDIAVLDYHLGKGKFGTEVAEKLRRRRPHVPIIILSATLEERFGGVEDMHLLKGYSSIEDLLVTLRQFEARQRGERVVVDALEFYYSRIAVAIGLDVLIQIMDATGTWHYVNDSAAAYLGQPREWFPGKNCHAEMNLGMRDWSEVLQSVSSSRETYIDRTCRGLMLKPRKDEADATWSVIAFPIMLHGGDNGVVLSARILQ